MTDLLDGNVLVALADDGHVHHSRGSHLVRRARPGPSPRPRRPRERSSGTSSGAAKAQARPSVSSRHGPATPGMSSGRTMLPMTRRPCEGSSAIDRSPMPTSLHALARSEGGLRHWTRAWPRLTRTWSTSSTRTADERLSAPTGGPASRPGLEHPGGQFVLDLTSTLIASIDHPAVVVVRVNDQDLDLVNVAGQLLDAATK